MPSPTTVPIYIALVLPVTRASDHPVPLDIAAILIRAYTIANVEDMHIH